MAASHADNGRALAHLVCFRKTRGVVWETQCTVYDHGCTGFIRHGLSMSVIGQTAGFRLRRDSTRQPSDEDPSNSPGTFLPSERCGRVSPMKGYFSLITLVALGAGFSSALAAPPGKGLIAEARHAVGAQLYAPASAVFRRTETTSLGDTCGEVDSRNIEGSRTGFARFIYDHKTRKALLSLHDPDFHQFFVMDDNEYTNGNAALITDDACRFVEKWVATCPSDLVRNELHAKALCSLYKAGSNGRSRLKKLVGGG